MKIANPVAINNSRFSELPEEKYGESRMKVPTTIATPGNASENIWPVLLDNIMSEFFHFSIALTRIRGEINLKIRVNKARGQSNSGDVEA